MYCSNSHGDTIKVERIESLYYDIFLYHVTVVSDKKYIAR